MNIEEEGVDEYEYLGDQYLGADGIDWDMEELLQSFFIDHLVFYAVSEDHWDYHGYIESCVVGGELNRLQLLNGTYFLANGGLTHICGTEEDLQAFRLWIDWAYAPESLGCAYPCLNQFMDYSLLPKVCPNISENLTEADGDAALFGGLDRGFRDKLEIVLFYRRYPVFYDVAHYWAFKCYLLCVVPGGSLQYHAADKRFYFVNDGRFYEVGLYGELELFKRWCAAVHNAKCDGHCGDWYLDNLDMVEPCEIWDPELADEIDAILEWNKSKKWNDDDK